MLKVGGKNRNRKDGKTENLDKYFQRVAVFARFVQLG